MRKKKNGSGGVTFVFNRRDGLTEVENLQEEIKKTEKEIEGWSKDLHFWKWHYEHAKKDYDFRVEKIRDLKDFMKLLQDHLQKIESGEIEAQY